MRKLLPNYFKKIGIAGIILAIAAFLITYIDPTLLSINHLAQKWIIKDIFLLSLLFITFSREKTEDEKIRGLKLQKIGQALIFGAGVYLFETLVQIPSWDEKVEIKSGFEILAVILIYFIITFYLDRYNYSSSKK